MANKFLLEIMTPERAFLTDEVTFVIVSCIDGQLCVLKGHTPMVAALQIGELTIGYENETRTAINTEGYMEVRPDRVLIFVQSCEWPGEIDEKRAQMAYERAQESLRQKQSIYENKSTKIALMRAMVRLSASRKPNKYNQ